MTETNPATRRIRYWLIGLLLMSAVVTISYAWLDRPLAYFAHGELRQFDVFERLTHIPEWFAPLAIVFFLLIGLRGLAGYPLAKPEAVMLLCSLSLVTASAIKNQLKIIFGRTWPETWVNANPSLIRDGAYGFNPFRTGQAFESFPSGHTTAVCAVMSVLWICYPRFRALYAIIVAAVAIGLIGADFHFLSDIIAGAFVGSSTGWVAVVLWRSRNAEASGKL